MPEFKTILAPGAPWPYAVAAPLPVKTRKRNTKGDGLGHTQIAILQKVNSAGEIGLPELAEHIGQDARDISKTVRGLRDHGLLNTTTRKCQDHHNRIVLFISRKDTK